VYLHPRYNSQQADWDINPTWNIGLVKLKKPVHGVPRVSLASQKPAIGSELTSVGLGNNTLVGDEENDYFSLLQSQVEVVSQKICEKYLPGQKQGHRSLFCAWTPKRGPCTLDEGTGAF
jgi:hypothetical protein